MNTKPVILVYAGDCDDPQIWTGNVSNECFGKLKLLNNKYFNSDYINHLIDTVYTSDGHVRFAEYGLRKLSESEPMHVSGHLIVTGYYS